MELQVLDTDFTVCRIDDLAEVDLRDTFCFVGKTDAELSLVCATACVPPHTLEREDGWRGFRVGGVLDFSLVGILAGIAGVLADERISVFAVSTFQTDYMLIKEKDFARALAALAARGYTVTGQVCAADKL